MANQRLCITNIKNFSIKSRLCQYLVQHFVGVDDGARTHDHRNHNPGLYQLSYTHHSTKHYYILHRTNGASGRTRTCYPRLRRPMLYPDELRTHARKTWSGQRDSNSRHPAPKAGALPDCAIPRFQVFLRLTVKLPFRRSANNTFDDKLRQAYFSILAHDIFHWFLLPKYRLLKFIAMQVTCTSFIRFPEKIHVTYAV